MRLASNMIIGQMAHVHVEQKSNKSASRRSVRAKKNSTDSRRNRYMHFSARGIRA